MEIQGIVIAAMPTQKGVSQKSGRDWMSRDYVLEIPGRFPSHMVFRVFGEDRLRQFDIRKNDEVIVKFDIDAHEYKERWFNQINAYDVQKVQSQSTSPVETQQQVAQNNVNTRETPQNLPKEADDDLPF